MNIRRYLAPDMRTAFKLVREELGPDVVILSTRRARGQIELDGGERPDSGGLEHAEQQPCAR
jgi:flagellar biosynthesis protein FlhF